MIYTFRALDDATWGRAFTEARAASRFTVSWDQALDHVGNEVDLLAGDDTEAVLELACRPADLYASGVGLKANARALRHPGVALSFRSPQLGPLRFVSDGYDGPGQWGYLEGWRANVRAIGLHLEALRSIDRYGVATRGQQYAGWQALGSGTPMGSGGAAPPMRPDDAILGIARVIGWSIQDVDADRARACRLALLASHPDHGGDRAEFELVQRARDVLLGRS